MLRESRQLGSRLNTRQARRTRSPARSPGQPLSRAGFATDLWALSFDDDGVPGRGAGFPPLGATAAGSRRAKSDPIARRANRAATLRPTLMPGTSIREYIARAVISDNTGAIRTAAIIPIVGWSQYVIANKIGK